MRLRYLLGHLLLRPELVEGRVIWIIQGLLTLKSMDYVKRLVFYFFIEILILVKVLII